MKCSICGKPAEIVLPEYHKAFCREHFPDWYYEKTKRFTRKLTKPKDKIAIAISGGKDSIALAIFFSKYSREFDVDTFLFHIDLGIGDYSRKARKEVKKVSRDLGLDLVVYDLKKETGKSVPELVRGSRPPCSACGVVKRYLMNKVPRELGANKLATGHNLDDQLENFFKNWISGNFDWLAKQKPILPGSGKLITKIKPLFERKEEENAFYVVSSGFDLPDFKCNFSQRKKSKWRKIADSIELENPGFKLSIAKSLERFDYPVKQDLGECKICGEPTNQEICSFCRLTGSSLARYT